MAASGHRTEFPRWINDPQYANRETDDFGPEKGETNCSAFQALTESTTGAKRPVVSRIYPGPPDGARQPSRSGPANEAAAQVHPEGDGGGCLQGGTHCAHKLRAGTRRTGVARWHWCTGFDLRSVLQ